MLKLIPFDTMRRRQLVPFASRDGKLLVAMAHPDDPAAADDVRILTGREVEPYAASSEEILEALHRHFAGTDSLPECSALTEAGKARAAQGEEGSPVARVVDKLLTIAAEQRASDVHLEPQRNGLFVRFRIDGVLKTVHAFPPAETAPVTSRIKVMARMDIAERRLPQDGQIGFAGPRGEIDLRVSTLPSKYGEKVVIRLLDKSGMAIDLERLGMEADAQGLFESLIERPHGIILVTGPTGSGKTTTLYSVLNRVRSPLKNIITLEDPIEYELLAGSSNEMGITQVQVQPKVGFTFAGGLRAALRQDPDVIMVGEIRDGETAEVAVKASMTGHLVLSTLHTNDAPSALGRLRDMGVDPCFVTSSVIGVLAQRLVRLLCPACKEAYRPPARALKKLFPQQDPAGAVFYRPVGCARCHGSGYHGRIGVFELLIMNEAIRERLSGGAETPVPRELLQASGYRTLRDSGMGLVFRGMTTVEEIARVTVG